MSEINIGDKVYVIFEPINYVKKLNEDNFGIVEDIKVEIWEHPHNGSEFEKNKYTVKTKNNLYYDLSESKIFSLELLYNILIGRELETRKMLNLLSSKLLEEERNNN